VTTAQTTQLEGRPDN